MKYGKEISDTRLLQIHYSDNRLENLQTKNIKEEDRRLFKNYEYIKNYNT